MKVLPAHEGIAPGPRSTESVQRRPDLLTVKQAAMALAISRTKVFDLLASSSLRSLKIGRARRIPRAELERFITEATAASTQANPE